MKILFKCRLQKVASLLSCLALCPQFGNQTIWFKTCIFTDLDFLSGTAPLSFYVHFIVGTITIFENGVIFKVRLEEEDLALVRG